MSSSRRPTADTYNDDDESTSTECIPNTLLYLGTVNYNEMVKSYTSN